MLALVCLCLCQFVHPRPAPPLSEEQCREEQIAAELSRQRMEHLRRLAGSSFEDPVSGRAAQGRTVCSLLHCVFCFCLFLQPPCEGTVRVQVMGELGECEGAGDGGAG